MPGQYDRAARHLQLLQDPNTPWQTASNGLQYVDLGNGEVVLNKPSERQRLEQMLKDHAGFRRTFNTFRAAGIGIPLAAAVAPALLAGGASGGGTAAGQVAVSSSPFSMAAPTVSTAAAGGAGSGIASGGGMTLGRIFGSRGFDLGVNALTSLFGQRSQNNANRYATDANTRLLMEQIGLERERNARLDAAAELDRQDRLRQHDASESQRKREFDALEEDRGFNRGLVEAREARRAVFRPYSERALRTLGSILRIG